MTGQPDPMASRTREGRGRFDHDPQVAERDAQAAWLHARSWTYQQITGHLDIFKSAAFEAIQQALGEPLEEPASTAWAVELEKLDAVKRAAQSATESPSGLTSKVVTD